jgi:lipid A 3-O-deacylase
MRCKELFFISVLLLSASASLSQAIDNTVSFRNINSDRYFRIYYENDFFSGSDRDYTQGIYLEKVNPLFQKFPLTKILFRPQHYTDIKYGLSAEQDCYTPNFIAPAAIQFGDRPYAGVLFLKTFLTATNTDKLQRVSSMLSTGIIGAGAGGEQMQSAIHHLIHYTQPQGWHNQISNDAVINYQVNFEKELFFCPSLISVSSYTSARLGTLSDKLNAGATIMIGNFFSPYRNNKELGPKKFQWHVYEQPLINFVGFDATLQGGVFDHSSPYTIANADIERIVFQHRYGLVLVFKKLYLEYYQTANTIEFTTSVYHHTGGLEIGFGF